MKNLNTFVMILFKISGEIRHVFQENKGARYEEEGWQCHDVIGGKRLNPEGRKN
jgi:transketolase